MSDQLAPLTERKPAIRVEMFGCSEADIQPILWGIEEEQIPAIVNVTKHGDIAEIADIAAHASALNVGIAINGTTREVALHHRDLAGRPPLFTLNATEFSTEHLIRLGKNAARLVKGNPLEFEEQHPKHPKQKTNTVAGAMPLQPSMAQTDLAQAAVIPSAKEEQPMLNDDQEILVQQLAEQILAQLIQR